MSFPRPHRLMLASFLLAAVWIVATAIESSAQEPAVLEPVDDPLRLNGDGGMISEISAAPADRPEFPDEATAIELELDTLTLSPRTPVVRTRRPTRLERLHRSATTFGSRFYGAFTEALCPCDDCYDPEWHLLESASFWVDSPRPQSRTRFRWDYGAGMIFPDRAEYFWARIDGRGPSTQGGTLTYDSLDYHELSMYTETAHGNFSAFVITPYRSLYLEEAGHSAGFADLHIGTKSLLHDSPLLQVAFQMTTTVPSANPRKGLGTGHVALEPAILVGLAMTHRDYLQLQVAQWIPIGGDPLYEGALLRWGAAWNRVVWARDRDNVMTFNLDLAGWSFQDGSFTVPNLGAFPANDETYVYLGSGWRWLLCGRYEFGVGGLFAISDNHFAENLLRTDFTVRY